jgi:glutamate-5-semialdehyde dehydrogenase
MTAALTSSIAPPIAEETLSRLRASREAALWLRSSVTDTRNRVLLAVARLLVEHQYSVLAANAEDLAALSGMDPTRAIPAFRDRLLLTEQRIVQMVESLARVAALGDPLGEQVSRRVLPNGLLLRQIRSPLGVILMIFESRPNVAIEAFSLAFKSGNVILLRGGSESMRTTEAIYRIIAEALFENGAPPECIWGITNTDRALMTALLAQREWIDVVVPRGGEGLIDFVVRNSTIPIIKNDRGMCHVYVHDDADATMALEIIDNSKTHRPGVCNAMETVLVHRKLSESLLPALYSRLGAKNVEWFGCPETCRILAGEPGVSAATDASWDTEYLDLKMNCRLVDTIDEAIQHIEQHGSRHSEVIVTSSEIEARRFQEEIDAAAVYWNASTRFTDGFEFGLGGELGISTQKLHVRGPIGLRELTSVRWVIDGNGQIRK